VILIENLSIREVAASFRNFGLYLAGLLPGAENTVTYAPVYEIIGVIILLFGVGFLFISRHTRFLMKETNEPFRYTFWIDEFKPAVKSNEPEKGADTTNKNKNTEPDNSDPAGYSFDKSSSLLRHDLMERLNQRIGRFSLLDLSDLSKEPDAEQTLSAHIQIDGYYAIREHATGEWMIQVMPRVRIGSKGNPSTLSFPVRFALEPGEKKLSPERYNQLVERVYSSVATEIYQRIELDVKKKMEMFPTKYLRAVALSNEARDYMRSNTVDAYDHAIELYREALDYFRVTDSKWKKYLLIPIFWRFRVKFLHARAEVEIGFAECLIYRRLVSALTGRYHNPLFEIPANLSEVINYLERLHQLMIPGGRAAFFYRNSSVKKDEIKENRLKSIFTYFEYPVDTTLRRLFMQPKRALFLKQTRIRFEACLAISLAYYYLGAIRSAQNFLLNAKAIHPERSENDALYLLTAANIESDLAERMILLRKTAEIAPDFEIALFMLAQNAEMGFRREDEIIPERAQRIIKKYEEVLKINPGNIAALSSLGYVLWLVDLKDEATRYLLEGCEAKAIVRQTFTGHLNYGLARIYAEQGRLQASYDHYIDAISADPGVGVYNSAPMDGLAFSSPGDSRNMQGALTGSPIITPYYDYIGHGMFNRFKQFLETFEDKMNEERDRLFSNGESLNQKETIRNKTISVVYSFVLNDYANACMNYYLSDRSGLRSELDHAIAAYEKAVEADPKNKTALFNLQQAYSIRGKEDDLEKGMECLKLAERMGPTWLPVLITSINSGFRQKINLRNDKKRRIEEISKKSQAGNPARSNPAGDHSHTFSDSITGDSSRTLEQSHHFYPQSKNGVRERTDRILIEDLTREIEELCAQISEVEKEFERILERTKLAFLKFHKTDNQTEDLPDAVSARKILNEIDVNALIIWLEISLEKDYMNFKDDAKLKESFIKLCKYLQQFYPGQFNHNYLIGTKYYNQTQYSIANELFLSACEEENYENDGYSNMLGNAFFGMEQYENAISNYKKAIKINDKNPIYYCNCGQAYGRLGEWNLMLKYCRKAVELRIKASRDYYPLDYYYEYLAEAIFQNEGWDSENNNFINDEALKSEPKARLNNRIGNLFFEVNDYLNAIPFYEKAISYEPAIPIYHCNLGRAYGNLIVPDYNKMLQHCKRAVNLRKSYSDDILGLEYYFEFLAEAYFLSGELDIFLGKIESDKVLNNREKASVFNKIGQLHRSDNQLDEAIDYFQKAIDLDPHNSLYQSNTGLAYTSLMKWPEAEEAIMKAIDSDPENALYYNDLGNVYYRNNRFKDAVKCYQKAISLKPDIAVYHSNLGLAYTNLEQWEDAEKSVMQAISLDPHNAHYQNDLGNIYYNSGYFVKAIHCYNLAISLDPENDTYKSNRELARNHLPMNLQDL